MQMNIRLASMEDIPALEQLIPESFRVLSTSYYNLKQIESVLAHVIGVDTQLILDETYFVAETEGTIIGCGGWSKRKTLFGGDHSKSNEIDQLLDPRKDPARIRAFFVHPQWSRKGIGRHIVKACEDAASKARFIKLELVATLPGEPFYSAMGYTVTERIKVPIPDAEPLPATRMEKRLGTGLIGIINRI
ncbi:MAG: GNAT family N-acetyltransferase [Chloroflexi bacterium]|nr:GNAT family N-acetyltransferase [Chloroflexota bacterium]